MKCYYSMATLSSTITLSWLKQFYVNMKVQLRSYVVLFVFLTRRCILFQAGSTRECHELAA